MCRRPLRSTVRSWARWPRVPIHQGPSGLFAFEDNQQPGWAVLTEELGRPLPIMGAHGEDAVVQLIDAEGGFPTIWPLGWGDVHRLRMCALVQLVVPRGFCPARDADGVTVPRERQPVGPLDLPVGEFLPVHNHANQTPGSLKPLSVPLCPVFLGLTAGQQQRGSPNCPYPLPHREPPCSTP